MPTWQWYINFGYGDYQHSGNTSGNDCFVNNNPDLPYEFQLRENSFAIGKGVNIHNEIYDYFNNKYLDRLDYNNNVWHDPPSLGAFGMSYQNAPPSQPTSLKIMPAELDSNQNK
jgi:acetyltransferase-like isoleucine patch superfamily enzyme